MSQVTRQMSIVLLGSTGSIGTQTLDVLRKHKSEFKVVGLAAFQQKKLLEKQCKEFGVSNSVLIQQDGLAALETMIEKLKPDIVLNAMHGVDSLAVTKKALQKAKKVLIANKELLVSHGRELIKIAKKYKSVIVPVDSEITGILQCLQGENPKNIEKIILTCSGGPFYKKTKAQLKNVTREQALRHPTWKMGKKITIDSATLMNKGFELIVASSFFGVPQEKIEIVIHPQSIIHAFIQWNDGNLTAALSPTDMRHTIQYALFFPERRGNSMPHLDLTKFQFSFEKPNEKIFTTLSLARKATGSEKLAAKLCSANDEAVEKFLNGKIQFLKIFDILKK